MKNRFFIILCLLICSTWNQSLEGITEERKKEIIAALQNQNTDLSSTVLNKDEINADLGNTKFIHPILNNTYIDLQQTTPLAYLIEFDIVDQKRIKYLLNNNADLLKEYSYKSSKQIQNEFKKEYPLNKLIPYLNYYHVEIVNWFIRNNKPISIYQDKDINTLFHLLASNNDYLESFKKLYEKNRDLNHFYKKNKNGQTPLHIATKTIITSNKIAEYIINQDVDLTKEYTIEENNNNNTHIMFDYFWQKSWNPPELRLNACNNILNQKKEGTRLNKNDDKLIHYAAIHDKFLNPMQILITNSSIEQLESQNKYGKTALHVAIDEAVKKLQYGEPILNNEIIKELIKSDSYSFTKFYKIKNDSGNEKESTLFEYLTSNLKNDALLSLALKSIIKSKDFKKPLNKQGDKLIHYFAQNDKYINGMNKILNSHPVNVIQQTNKDGKTALHKAIDRAEGNLKSSLNIQNMKIIEALITSNKFDLTQVYEIQKADGSKPKDNLFNYLKDKLKNDNFNKLAIQSIIDKNSMNNVITDYNGATLFHYLAGNRFLFKEFFSQIKDNFKKNINIKNKFGHTPLFNAQDITTFIDIINSGADLTVTINNGDTILHHTAIINIWDNSNYVPNSEFLRYLLEKKTTIVKNLINKKNNDNKTAFDLVIDKIQSNPAACNQYTDHIELLLQYGAEIGGAIDTLKSINKNNKYPLIAKLINFIGNKKNQFSGSGPGPKPGPKPGPTSDALSQQLSKLNMELINLRKKLKALAKNLGTLKSGMAPKNTTSTNSKYSKYEL